MRIAVEPFLRVRNTHLFEYADNRGVGVSPSNIRVNTQRLRYLISHRHHRIEASHGLLKDHGERSTPESGEFTLRKTRKVTALKQYFSFISLAWRFNQSHDGPGRHTFAAARFAYDAHD